MTDNSEPKITIKYLCQEIRSGRLTFDEGIDELVKDSSNPLNEVEVIVNDTRANKFSSLSRMASSQMTRPGCSPLKRANGQNRRPTCQNRSSKPTGKSSWTGLRGSYQRIN